MECVERLSLEGEGGPTGHHNQWQKNEKDKKKKSRPPLSVIVILNQTLALLYQFTNDEAFLYLESDAPCDNTAQANI